MKTRISKLNFGTDKLGDIIFYTAEFKKHWWNKWRFVMNPKSRVPALFRDKASALLIAETGVKEWNFEEEFNKEFK